MILGKVEREGKGVMIVVVYYSHASLASPGAALGAGPGHGLAPSAGCPERARQLFLKRKL